MQTKDDLIRLASRSAFRHVAAEYLELMLPNTVLLATLHLNPELESAYYGELCWAEEVADTLFFSCSEGRLFIERVDNVSKP